MLQNMIFALSQKNTIIVVVVILAFVALVVLIYLSSVFVDKKYNKIIERLGKYKKTVKPGWHFMIPLLDSAVESIDMSPQTLLVTKPISIVTKNEKNYEIDYSLRFVTVDAAKYYYATKDSTDVLFIETSKRFVEYFKDVEIESVEKFLKKNDSKLLSLIKPIGEPLGIEVEEIIITSLAIK